MKTCLDSRVLRLFAAIVLTAALLVGLCVGGVRADATSGAITLVTPTSATPGAATRYVINATFNSEVGAGSSITVVFDPSLVSGATDVPSSITSGVSIGGFPAAAISVYGRQVTLITSPQLSPSLATSIIFETTCQIRPIQEGTHSVSVMYQQALAVATYSVSAQSGAPVTFDSISMDDLGLGRVSLRKFTFYTGVTLLPGSSISIQFPPAFGVPASIDGVFFALFQSNSLVNGFPNHVSVGGNVVTLTIPNIPPAGGTYSSFGPGAAITIQCGAGALITNPQAGGSYQFELWTSVQSTHAVKSITMGTGVVNPTVVVTPTVAGGAAEYRVSLSASVVGSLQAGTGKVSVVFPAGFVLPSSIASGLVTVNGMAAGATVSGQALSVTVPAAISSSGAISVAVDKAAGIRNGPANTTGYQLTVTTSADQLPVQTNAFAVSASVVSSVTVSVVPAVKGASASQTVTFTTGAGGALGVGDTISLFLPYGFMIPSTIDRTQVTIKTPATAAAGIQPASVQCTPSSQSIVLTLPSGSSIVAGASVAVSLPAVVTNPTVGGAFTTKVSTSKETTAVDSTSFTIFNNPVSTLTITPATADGKAGYYTSQPSFTLAVDGPAGVTISAFYRIDDAGAYVVYDLKTSPSVKVPEGRHTVHYYSQDSLGNVESTRSQQILVDLTDPLITVTAPVQNSVVVQASASVTGKVQSIDASVVSLTVGGLSVPVAADGSFSAVVAFRHEGVNPVDVVATSLSGRTKMLTLSVNYIARVTMTLVIGSPTVNLNNEFKTLEAAPFISKKGVTMVPLRFISEAFKADVVWDPVFKSVTLTLGSKIMRIQVGFLTADVSGKSVALQDAPVIVKGRTFVPLRFIAENFGALVEWNGALKMVSIVYPKP
ncbi:MAG: stalk domain-containing protein [Candidatus Cryosericum sp.]